jgi:ATP/maltotriose-dependent transcriptional regulator MalT
MVWAGAALAVGDAPVALALSTEAERALRITENDYNRHTAAAGLAESLTLLDRLDEAEAHLAYAREADPTDLQTHVMVQRAAARMALARGDIAEAERSTTEASRLLEGAEAPLEQAQVLIVWSEVHTATGATDRARDALTRARRLMIHKGAEAAVRHIDTLMMP